MNSVCYITHRSCNCCVRGRKIIINTNHKIEFILVFPGNIISRFKRNHVVLHIMHFIRHFAPETILIII